jgi:lysophospholipase L1-like esterase
MQRVLVLSLLLQSLPFIAAKEEQAANGGAILVLGDSWASLSGDYLSNVCGPQSYRNVQNDAKSGTTAEEWASDGTAIQSMSKASYEYDYVWLSLGGNDFLDNQCDIEITEQVGTDIVTVISHIVENSSNQDNLKILYFGYSIPSYDICGDGTTASLFREQGSLIRTAIKKSNYSEYVTVMDVSKEFVTYSSSPLSDSKYYVDEIHMNENGYLKLFSKIRIQRFFGCSGVVMPLINAGNEMRTWSVAKLLSVAGTFMAFSVLVCYLLCKRCCGRKGRDDEKSIALIPTKNKVTEEEEDGVLVGSMA